MIHYWFRAFGGDTTGLARLAEVLLEGPSPPPPHISTSVVDDEISLGIPNRCTYLYLSRLHPGFGDIALAFDLSAITQHITPFDSGGLLANIHPVCEWENDSIRAYLSDYTFPASQLYELLEVHPGLAAESYESYVDGNPPSVSGPHVQLNSSSEFEANIWAHPQNSWRSWVWEGRQSSRISTAGHLRHWTSSTAVYNRLRDHVETLADPSIGTAILKRWRPGGPGKLFQAFKSGGLAHV